MVQEEILDLVISDFRQGMVTNVDSSDKDLSAFDEIKNARIDVEDGSLVKRLQATYYNEESLGDSPIMGGVRFYFGTDSKELIIAYDTFLKKGDDALGTFSNIKTGLTAGNRFSFLQYKDRLYGFNGVDSNQRYDGTNVKTMGCAIPGTAPSAAEGAAGAIGAGTYQYKVTFLYDGFQESNPNATAASVTIGASKKVNLTSIPTGAAGQGVTARKIYRTLAGGSVFYYVATISDNTTTTHEDNTNDSGLTIELKTNHDVPPIWKMAVLHKDRIFGLKPNSCEIDFTLIENYTSLPDIHDSVNNYIMVNEDDGSDAVSIEAIENGVLVFKRSGTYLINTSAGNDPLLWSIDKIDIRGTCAPYSVSATTKGVIALCLDKEAELDLRLFTASGSISLGKRVKDILNSINHLYYDEVVGKYHGGRYYLSFTDNFAGLSYNHKILVFQFNDDFSLFGYTVDDGNINCFIPAFGKGDFGQMYAGMSTIGKVLRLETRTADVIHKTAADINTGTLTRLVEGGTEEYPEYTLDPDGFTGLFSNTVIEDLSEVIEDYSDDEDDIINNAGLITSDILYIGANALYLAFWTAALGDNGGTALRLRTGDTEAECSTASWSEWLTDPEGSDISGVTAKKYVQYQALIASQDLPDAETKFYREDFVVKIASGLGAAFEEYINFLLDTGKIDLGKKDRVKRLRSVVVEYETSGTTLQLYLAKNDDTPALVESISTDTYPNIRQVILPFSYFGEFFRLKLSEQSLNALKIKSIRLRFSVLPMNAQVLLRGRG